MTCALISVSMETDWVFLGTVKQSPWTAEIDKMKNVRLFDDFVEMGDSDFINLGVMTNEVRSKILAAVKVWNDEHQLPGNLSFFFFPPIFPTIT